MTDGPRPAGGRRGRWHWTAAAAGFAVVALAAYELDIAGGGLGRALAPAVGLAPEEPLGAPFRALVALFAAALVLANVAALRLVPFKVQIGIVWAELLLLFLAFFYSFDLKFAIILDKLPFLTGVVLTPQGFVQGAVLTLFVCFLGIVASTTLGFVAALGRLSGNGILFGVATFYISFFRGTPLLVQVFLIYLGLPQVGLVLDAIPSGVAALALCYGAYIAEIIRAGIQSIARGQWEAATALGLRPALIMRKIILPQAMRVIVPPTGSQFISMLKDSSLVSMMGVWELMFLARAYGRAEYRYIEMLLAAAVIYWVMSICFELIQTRIERYYGKGFHR